MAMTSWTVARLTRLFEHYRQRFWSGRLPTYAITVAPLENAFGRCDHDECCVIIDISRHTSDRGVRSTLLHEMAHVAAGPQSLGHDSAFFAQLARLLRRRAPIGMGSAENENRPFLHVIPKHFVLCRRALRATYARRTRAIEGLIEQQRREGRPVSEIDAADAAVSDAENVGMEGVPWRGALLAIGREYGLLDIDNKPLPWATEIVRRARQAHARAYGFWREEEQAKAVLEEALAASKMKPGGGADS